ncbi:MAG: hypothetical protein CMH54_09040 [Myxococcales bacterium]|nr:hypothetical protein [Myxococcales bacterium]
MKPSLRTLVCTALLWIGLAGCGAESAGDADVDSTVREFQLLTYNVAGLPQGLSSSNPELYIPMISPLLNAYDVVLVQEDFWYHDELSAAVELPYQSEPMWEEPTIETMGDGLNRFSTFPFTDHIRVVWPNCHGHLDCASDCLATKGFSVARTELEEGVFVDIYNLHAEAGGCPEDYTARREGVLALKDHILEHSDGEAILVAGDYNLSESDPQDKELLEEFRTLTGLEETCARLSCGVDSIDKIMIRSSESLELIPLQWEIPSNFVDANGNNLSDHPPIVGRFGWKMR